mmetsp:Transcript_56763/g.158042  ORF Transcript_56763/g.158042 Transcript_56763/m.158042 type:complete len:140 (-) Transcript_56763:113-532(-)
MSRAGAIATAFAAQGETALAGEQNHWQDLPKVSVVQNGIGPPPTGAVPFMCYKVMHVSKLTDAPDTSPILLSMQPSRHSSSPPEQFKVDLAPPTQQCAPAGVLLALQALGSIPRALAAIPRTPPRPTLQRRLNAGHGFL